MQFDDPISSYSLCVGESGQLFVHREEQKRDEAKWKEAIKSAHSKLKYSGIYCPLDEINVLVRTHRLDAIRFNNEASNHFFYKIYEKDGDWLPLSVLLRSRDPTHHLEMEKRLDNPASFIKSNSEMLCLKAYAFGLKSRCVGIDAESGNPIASFDAKDAAKVHDPFLGHKIIEQVNQSSGAGQYFTDQYIDSQLELPRGTTGALTSSFMLAYRCPVKKSKAIAEIGLNLKSMKKRQ